MRNRRLRTGLCVHDHGHELSGALRAELEALDVGLVHEAGDWDDVLRRADVLRPAELWPAGAPPIGVSCTRSGRADPGCVERRECPGAPVDALGWGTRAL
jgi:hypothetical protein